jgi:predicted ArsR family transcriptional regulator
VAGTRWQAVAALVDPVRRALYDHVRQQRHPVSREEAADAVSISRNLSAFHLDKLVDAGLLRARYEAPADQPRGRGRAPKVYEPTDGALTMSVPPRRYELVGEILAEAVAGEPNDARAAAERHATNAGRRIGAARIASPAPSPAPSPTRSPGPSPAPSPGPDAGDRPSTDGDLAPAYAALADLGFEPRIGDTGEVSLGNCPFHRLAVRHPELVCGLNEALITGLLDGLGADQLCARLQPEPGSCCVRVAPVATKGMAATKG